MVRLKRAALGLTFMRLKRLLTWREALRREFSTGCAVTYRQVKAQYHRRWDELTEERILDHLSRSNFLTYHQSMDECRIQR